MKRNMTLGAVLVGVGLGLLINAWFPWLRWAWSLGLIVGGVLLWREIGPYSARIALIAAALTIPVLGEARFGLFGFDTNWGRGRELARSEVEGDETGWDEIEGLLIVNTVGDIQVEADDELEVEVVYRGQRRNPNVPEALQADFDSISKTLRIIGVDPKLSESERRGLSADIKVHVPESVRLEIINEISDIQVKELMSVELSNEVGDVQVSQIADDVVVTTSTGDIHLANAGGDIRTETTTGDIGIELEQPLNASLEATSDVGDVILSLSDDSNVTVSAVSEMRDLSGDLEKVTGTEGRLRLGSGEHPVALRTRVGEVSVRER